VRIRTILTLAILLPACFAVAGWSEPCGTQPLCKLLGPATQNGSVSGKISAMEANTFSVEVQNSQARVTLKFQIDSNTKIDGNLKVGSMVTVDYRTEDVNNIAVRVAVQPAAQS
jgi:Domain of unknown function (DUF5666)